MMEDILALHRVADLVQGVLLEEILRDAGDFGQVRVPSCGLERDHPRVLEAEPLEDVPELPHIPRPLPGAQGLEDACLQYGPRALSFPDEDIEEPFHVLESPPERGDL